MFNGTHDIDEGTSSNVSTSPATELDAVSVFAEYKTLEIETEGATRAPETQCEGGVCSLNWTPGTRH